MNLVETLKSVVKKYNITFERDVTPTPFFEVHMRQISLHLHTFKFTFQVDDEYNVVNSAKPELLLNLVLMECTWYLEEDDYLTWCTSKGLNAGDETVREYYRGIGAVISSLQTILGNVGHTSFYDWQLNAGDAQILRKYSAKLS